MVNSLEPSFERLMGVETEYACVGLSPDGRAVDAEVLAKDLLRIARRNLVHLREPGANGVFMGNGGRFYVDAGFHPEMATPECTTPTEVVRYIEAGDRILAQVTEILTGQRSNLREIQGFKCNVDYSSDSRSTWGCHESYLHRTDPAELPRDIVPHLVSRIVFSGAGGFNSIKSETEFLISPRAPHLVAACSSNSTSHRGIFHTKDEPLGPKGYHRLHVISGESLCSRIGSWLKIGTTALVVAMSEAGLKPGLGVQLLNPVQALGSIAADPSCRAQVAVKGRGRRTAIEIQRHYLELAISHLGDPYMPQWAGPVCREWERMLDALGNAPESVATRLDWAIKWTLFSNYLRREGTDWDNLPMDVAHRLFEIDMRFGQIGRRGIFEKLFAEGVLDCDAPGVEDVESAMSEPPADSRAKVRGEWIQRLSGQSALCDWQAIVHGPRRLDLSDPFAQSAEWTDAPTGEPLKSLFDAIGL